MIHVHSRRVQAKALMLIHSGTDDKVCVHDYLIDKEAPLIELSNTVPKI